MEIKKVGLASDHAGYPLKKFVEQYLEEKGYPVQDYGCWSDTSVDYPDYAHALAEGIEDGICNVGIGICGSGEGMVSPSTSIRQCVQDSHGARKWQDSADSTTTPMSSCSRDASSTTMRQRKSLTHSSRQISRQDATSAV